MKKTTFILLYSLGVVIAQTQSNWDFKMSVVEKDTIGILEPVVYELTLVNLSDKTKNVLFPWNEAFQPGLEIKRKGKSEWEEIPGSTWRQDYLHSVKWSAAAPLGKWEMNPKQSISMESVLSPIVWPDTSQNYVFDRRGIFQLRAVYYPPGQNAGSPIYSNAVTIYVIPYKGEDKRAFKYLEKLPIPHFVYSALITHGPNIFSNSSMLSEGIKSSEELIERYPASQFTPWARFFLAGIGMAKARGLRGEEKEKELRNVLALTHQAYQETSDERLKKLIVEIQYILRLQNIK
jgi:hypothetical protein